MALYYYPFESHETGDESNPYDRAITAEQERMFNKLRYVNGVFNPDGGALRVTSNSNMTVTVGTGGCHIEGAIAYNDAPITLAIEAADATLNRIDRVVAQFNTSDSVRAISILVRTGTAATNPIAPELRRESNLYEIALADVYVGKNVSSIDTANITDLRLNSDLCGQVVPAIPTPLDLTGIYDQYQASLNEWLETVASALDGTLAGNLQGQITALDESLNTIAPDGIVDVSHGGTGKTTNTANSVLVGNGASAIKNIASANGALYATSANGAPKFGTLPIAQGGTGKTTALEALLAIGGIQIKKLWENASPTSEFLSQNITLDLSEYEYLLLGFKLDISKGEVYYQIVSKFNGSDTYLWSIKDMRSSYEPLFLTRAVSAHDSYAWFGDSNYKPFSQSTASFKRNTDLIPVIILGLRGVL